MIATTDVTLPLLAWVAVIVVLVLFLLVPPRWPR